MFLNYGSFFAMENQMPRNIEIHVKKCFDTFNL